MICQDREFLENRRFVLVNSKFIAGDSESAVLDFLSGKDDLVLRVMP